MPTRTVHPTRIPNQPDRARIENRPNQHSNGRWRVTTHKTRHLRVSWRFSSPKTWATRPDHKPRNFRQYLKVLWRNHTKSDDIGSYPAKIYLKPIILDEISEISSRSSLDPTRCGEVSLRSSEILSRSGQISTDPTKYQLDLNGSGQNNDIEDKNQNRPMNPKT